MYLVLKGRHLSGSAFCNFYRLGVPEQAQQALGGVPLDFCDGGTWTTMYVWFFFTLPFAISIGWKRLSRHSRHWVAILLGFWDCCGRWTTMYVWFFFITTIEQKTYTLFVYSIKNTSSDTSAREPSSAKKTTQFFCSINIQPSLET